MKKYAFVGSACVGKTTMLAACRDHFRGDESVVIVDEVARRFFESHPSTTHLTLETQELLAHMIIDAELRVMGEPRATTILCDRSVADAIPYVEVAGDGRAACRLESELAPWLATYSRFFLLDPADVVYQSDGIRTETPAARQQLHEGFIALFERAGLPYEILSGSLDERLARVISRVSVV